MLLLTFQVVAPHPCNDVAAKLTRCITLINAYLTNPSSLQPCDTKHKKTIGSIFFICINALPSDLVNVCYIKTVLNCVYCLQKTAQPLLQD